MKKLLIILDMQNDFVTGPLGSEAAKAIVPRMVRKIQRRRRKGYDIAYVFDVSDGDTNCPSPSLKKGYELASEIAATVRPSDYKIIKDAPHSPQLIAFLSTKNYKAVELVGVLTDECVHQTARWLKYVLPYIELTVDAACCAANTPEQHNAALRRLKHSGLIHVTHFHEKSLR